MTEASSTPSSRRGPRVLKTVALVGAMTGISRLAGLVREQLMAVIFGTGVEKSAFDVAFRIPNLFRRLFGEGALSAAFVPVYTEILAKEGPAAAHRLIGRVAGLLIAVLGGVAACGILATLALQEWLAPSSRWAVMLPLLRVMLPYAPLICLAALAMGVLNALRHFAIPALAPVFLNLIWIAALALVCPFLPDDPRLRIRVVAWSIVLAGVVQVIVQIPPLARRGVRLRLNLGWRGDPGVQRVLRLMGPMALGVGLIQINVCIDGILAMWAAPWGPAAMTYAERIVYLPLGLVGSAFATALLPTFSRQAAEADVAGLRDTLERALRNIALLMAPAAIGLTVLALPVVNLIYRWEKGLFDADSAIFTARALAGYAPGLLVFSFQKAVMPAFYALQDTRTPVRVGVCGVLMNLALNALFVATWPAGWKHMGIAVSTVIASLVNGATLAWILNRRLGAPRWAGIAGAYAKALAAALIMGAVAWFVHDAAMSAWGEGRSLKVAQLIAMGAAMATGAMFYAALVWVFCRSDILELAGDLKRGKRRKEDE